MFRKLVSGGGRVSELRCVPLVSVLSRAIRRRSRRWRGGRWAFTGCK